MNFPAITAYLTPPGLPPIDITDRVADIRTISATLEDDLAELVHGDVDIELDNRDGWIASTLANSTAADLWEFEIVRETRRRRPKWEIVFGGLLDLKTVIYERMDSTVKVQVFSFSQLLERTTAEDIKRDLTGRTGSVTSGTAAVTVSDATDILPGDVFELNLLSESEEFTVESVSGSVITATANLSITASPADPADLTPLTPYHRNKTIEWLADAVFSASGVDDDDITIRQVLAEFPIETEINTDGLPAPDPISIVEQDGQIVISYTASDRMAADTPQSGFASLVADNDPQADWRPYMLTQPTILEIPAADTGAYAADHENAHYYDLLETVNSPGNTTLDLRQDGSVLSRADTWADPLEDGYTAFWQEYEPQTGDVWVSYARGAGGGDFLKYYDGTWHTLSSSEAGALRSIRPLELMAFVPSGGTTMRLYDATARTVVRNVTVPSGITLWTIRAFDGFVAALYREYQTMRVRIWDADSWAQLADYAISTGSASDAFLTVFGEASGDEIAIGHSNGVYFVLARYFAGVIPYADFEDKSCADAIRDLALVSLSYVTVDEHKIGRLTGRTITTMGEPVELGIPLEQSSRKLWDFYRTSVEVSGESEYYRASIEEVAGDTGDSENRLSIDSTLITTTSLANVIANLYLSFFNVERAQEDVTIAEGDRLIRALDVVVLDGKQYLVLHPKTDLVERTQELTLVEI